MEVMERKMLYSTLVVILQLLMPFAASGQMLKPMSLPRQSPAPLVKKLPQVQFEKAQLREPGMPVQQSPRRAGNAEVYYKRPAGAFPGFIAMEQETYDLLGYYPYSTIQVAPYMPYTYRGVANGTVGNPVFSWDIPCLDPNTREETVVKIDGDQDVAVRYYGMSFDVPWMYVKDDANSYSYQMYSNALSDDGYYQMFFVTPWPDFPQVTDGIELLKSSTDFSFVINNGGASPYPFMAYTGMMPYGGNEHGYWLGKNAGYQGLHVNGIAQAFEKPEHPYLLNEVVLYASQLNVVDNVDMTCRIYRIDGLPDYNDTACVILPEEPGELIAAGTAHLAPVSSNEYGALVPFTLYSPEDGDFSWMVEKPLTIDDAILVVIDGYNDPTMSALADFTAFMGTEQHLNDGYGERGFLKVGKDDADGNFDGHYQWVGLNNFFSRGEMKTGISIFLTTQTPFLTSNFESDDFLYTFSPEGGEMVKTLKDENGEDVTVNGIEMASWLPSDGNGDFRITCDGGELPSWLNISLTDVTPNGEFNYLVNAQVVARPLDDGVNYREAVVRFAIPGTYMDYKFIQSRQGGEDPGTGPAVDCHFEMPDRTVTAGGTLIIPVSMTNNEEVVGFETDITLPEGFQIYNMDGKYAIGLGDRVGESHKCEVTPLPDGSVRLQCYSPDNVPFAGNEGLLFSLVVKVPDDALGEDYAVRLSNSTFTLGDLSEHHAEGDAVANITVKPYIPGDVNGDGEVSIADANTVIIIIINGGGSGGHSRLPGDMENFADINADGEINIADLNAIINLILASDD